MLPASLCVSGFAWQLLTLSLNHLLSIHPFPYSGTRAGGDGTQVLGMKAFIWCFLVRFETTLRC